MNLIGQLNDFLSGPCLYITVPICLAGLIKKGSAIIAGRRHGLLFPERSCKVYTNPGMDSSFSYEPAARFTERKPVFAWISILFHISLIAAPLTARAHWILIDQAWNIFPPGFNPAVTSACTGMAMVTGILLLLRRIILPHVSAVTSWRDYAAMLCVLIPFVSGMMGKAMIGPYETVMFIHFAGSHVLLLSLGWTRLGHFVFFTAGRISLPGAGSRSTA